MASSSAVGRVHSNDHVTEGQWFSQLIASPGVAHTSLRGVCSRVRQTSSERPGRASWPKLSFLERAENILLIGQPGVGKTHLSLALALRACQARQRVLFFRAMDLLDDLLAAEVSHQLHQRIETLGRLHLLVVDELGYLPMDTRRANLFFQLVNHLYTRVSMIVTSNVLFEAGARSSTTMSLPRPSWTACWITAMFS